MSKKFDIFIDHWHQIAVIWSQIALACAALIFMYYLLLLSTKRTLTSKHEFINSSEIRYLWYTCLSLILSFIFFLNSLIVRVHSTTTDYILTVKTLVSLGVGFLIGYGINTYLHVYYPFRLEKRLHTLRFRPRYNPQNGNEMHMLTEEEEDVHLSEEMIEHEIISAYEYDVWMDDETGYKIIEKYSGNLSLIICEKCNYRTSKEIKEEVVLEPTTSEPGKLKKSYKCSHCGYLQEKESQIAPLFSK